MSPVPAAAARRWPLLGQETKFANSKKCPSKPAKLLGRKDIVEATPTGNIVLALSDSEPEFENHGEIRRDSPFDDWGQVPADLRCRSQWLRQRRKVRDGAVPMAQVRNVDELAFNSSQFVGLFRYVQTRPYKPSSKTEAIWAYTDFFSRFASQVRYRLELNPRGWTTKSCKLGRQQFENHLRKKEPLGIFGGATTNFMLVDLDFHRSANREVFLQQLEVLVESSNGRYGCHYAFSEDCSGVHLIFLVEPQRLKPLQNTFRSWLRRL